MGEFKKDKKEGKGIIYYSTGDRKMGNYKDDKPIGKHIRINENWKTKSRAR